MATVKEEIIRKYQLHENDRGSAPVQIAILRTSSSAIRESSITVRKPPAIRSAMLLSCGWRGPPDGVR